ncbi:serine/threonine-protein kinase [Streptomyces luteolus]|uniref:non-specific serine/threonine protein kinase n=1 Tax=Streptomyces luteolus TaxID=3043615 RepID=A0ABT6SYC0_9ACTN|nr:serine/threonine-protein kinase [Streptomyces sp. B-S-A12]MDI3420607.1 protein kinase [Streptomyces sp. B-S-A12]
MDADAYTPEAGDVIDGRYELIEPLGKGGMAQVWRAGNFTAGEAGPRCSDVAVKFLRHDSEALSALDPHERESELAVRNARFRREADLLGSLDHPGIPQLYASGTHQAMPYMVMRLVDGVNLRTFLDEHSPLPLGTALAVAVQATMALECAHTLPVVHRDLKPANIMIDSAGSVVVIDFGIAKPLRADATRYTAHGSTLGTRGYLAPEQLLERTPTARTDVYCFGCIFYELLTGRPPFPLGQDSGLTEKHLKETPLPPSVYAAGVPDLIDDLVLRMLAKRPEERPTMTEVMTLLTPFAPRPGDAEPRPRTHPDPTAPLRLPELQRPPLHHPSPSAPADSPAPADGYWLDQREIEDLCVRAEAEIASGKPGDSTARVQGLTERVRDEWGERRPIVRRVWRTAADGFRLLSDHGSAADIYATIVADMIREDGPTERAERARIRLRRALCHLSFGDLSTAISAVEEAGRTAAGLPPDLAAELEELRIDVDTQLGARLMDP